MVKLRPVEFCTVEDIDRRLFKWIIRQVYILQIPQISLTQWPKLIYAIGGQV